MHVGYLLNDTEKWYVYCKYEFYTSNSWVQDETMNKFKIIQVTFLYTSYCQAPAWKYLTTLPSHIFFHYQGLCL